MKLKITPVDRIKGKISVPGDKSISHRAIILSSLAKGKSKISGFLESEDCLNTIKAFQKMGVEINNCSPGKYIVSGKGLRGLQKPSGVIDCGNSGTTIRLLTGILAAQDFYSVLTGDNSLRRRPMDRVTVPLSRMGAKIWSTDNKYAPLGIKGGSLQGISYKLPVASAQVKSSLLLAGLYAEGDLILTEPGQSRDHTERMLKDFGVNIITEENSIYLLKNNEIKLKARDIKVPGDISSAAFLMIAALIVPDSEVIIKNVGLNPTRSGIIDIIKKMGGNLELLNTTQISGEPIADIHIKSSELHNTVIKGDIIPRLIDEIPIIAVLASQAKGKTIIRDAAELRVKETDRIQTMVSELSKLGVNIKELPDGMVINGPCRITGGVNVESFGDHRVAMSLAIAGLLADKPIIINDSQAINISFPNFNKLLKSLYYHSSNLRSK